MEQFLTLPLADRILMLLISSGLLILLPFALIKIIKNGFGNLKKLRVGNVELNTESEQTQTHLQCTRVNDVLHLLELQDEMIEQYHEIASTHSILSNQSIKSEMIIDGFTTNLLAQLCEHEKYEEIARDFELTKFRLIQKLVLIYRENHLAEMSEGEFLAHLRIRAQTTANMALLHIRSDHPFYTVSNYNAVFELVVSCIMEAKEIAIKRKEQGKKIKAEFDEKKKQILGGGYAKI